MEKGFEIDQIEPLENYPTVLIFTTGSGIRSLIELGFNVDEGFKVKLFYGARNLERMAYQLNAEIADFNEAREKELPLLQEVDAKVKELRQTIEGLNNDQVKVRT